MPVTLGVDEDDQVLDQPIQAVGLDADVLGEGLATVRLELALRQQLGAAVDRRDGRAQLVRQDVEEGLAVALADQRRRAAARTRVSRPGRLRR